MSLANFRHTEESQTPGQLARSLLAKGIPKDLKVNVHKGGIGYVAGDVNHYTNRLFINVSSENMDAKQLRKIPFKELERTLPGSSDARKQKWSGFVKMSIFFAIVQVVLFLIFVQFYSPPEKVETPFTYPQSSFPETPVGAVVGANAPLGPRMLERAVWIAQPPLCAPNPHQLPLKTVVVLHTAGEECTTVPDCAKKIRLRQQYDINSEKWCDIGFNFLIGGDGNVYEGRGWDFMAAHTKGHNNGSLGVAFMGTFINKLPNEAQVEAFHRLIDVGISVQKIAHNYTLVANCQLTKSSDPGWTLANHMTEWPHYNHSLPIQCPNPQDEARRKEEL